MIDLSFKLGRVLLSSAIVGLIAALSLALLGDCTVTPEIDMTLLDTPTPASTQPTTLPTPSLLPILTPTPLPTALSSTDTPSMPNFSNLTQQLNVYLANTKNKGLIQMLDFRISNTAIDLLPPTQFFLFDGDPLQGGTLITKIEIPEMVKDEDYNVEVIWNVNGEAGEHQLFHFLCPAGVTPSPNICLAKGQSINIPRLGASLEISNEREIVRFPRGRQGPLFYRGDQVPITINIANLDRTTPISLNMVLEVVERKNSMTLAEASLALLPGEAIEQLYFYDTTNIDHRNIFARLDITGDEFYIESIDFFFFEDAYFIAEPLSGTVPLSVTFSDISSVSQWTEEWLWNFGDGLTSTLQSPVHTYTLPGLYTVTLTTLGPHDILYESALAIEAGTYSIERIDQKFTFTVTQSNYIEVLP